MPGTFNGQITMELPEIRQSHEKLETINEFKKKHRNSIQLNKGNKEQKNS